MKVLSLLLYNNNLGKKKQEQNLKEVLKQDKISFNHGKIVNIYIFYQVNKNFDISSYPTLENCLFGAVKLTKRLDYDQHKPF